MSTAVDHSGVDRVTRREGDRGTVLTCAVAGTGCTVVTMALDPADKKVALRAINYGLYVLTAAENGEYGAGGVNWVTQASFDPPLIVAAVKVDSDSHRIISSTGGFAVNVVGEDQYDIGKAF